VKSSEYDPHTHGGSLNEPEVQRMSPRGEMYLSAAEYLNRKFPLSRIVAPELGDEQKDVVLRLGQMAANYARKYGLRPLVPKLYHPDYPDGVNGWPIWVWDRTWNRLVDRFHIEYHSLPKEQRPISPWTPSVQDPVPPGEDYFRDRDPNFGAVHIVIRGKRRARCGTEDLIGVTNVIGARVCLRCVEDGLEEQLRQLRFRIARGER